MPVWVSSSQVYSPTAGFHHCSERQAVAVVSLVLLLVLLLLQVCSVLLYKYSAPLTCARLPG